MAPNRRSSVQRIALPVILLVTMALLTWTAGRSAAATFLGSYGISRGSVITLNRANRLNPRDPALHSALGGLFFANKDFSAAVAEYELAAAAGPNDYRHWLDLARAHSANNEADQAIEAARRGIFLAPDYYDLHWQLGLSLLRKHETNEGFKALRSAVRLDPTLMPELVRLAWRESDGSPESVIQLIEPQRPDTYRALAEFFKAKGAVNEAILMYSKAGIIARGDRREYVSRLIAEKSFNQAFSLWRMDHPKSVAEGVTDPGFENNVDLDAGGFGWLKNRNVSNYLVQIDSANPKEGNSALRVDFRGYSNPAEEIISQLVPVAPGERYRLRFAVRTEAIVTGGLPYLSVVDANSERVIAMSKVFPIRTDGWVVNELEFTAEPSSSAIRILLRRELCSIEVCSIFGRVWLDDFALQRH